MELITLVNDNDKIIGYGEKLKVHESGKLHRAFSVFIYDETCNRMLLQKRAVNKYHSGGLWTNACCSHPRKNEELYEAVKRRVKDELGIEIPEEDCLSGRFWESGKFTYKKDFGRYKEYEIDHVFIWKTDSVLLCLIPDKTEISEILWIDILELINWIELRPDEFTVWFLPALKQFFSDTEVHISKPLFDDISW